MNVGDITSEFAGHTVIDRSLVFGLGPSPEITHFGGTEPTEKAINESWVELDEDHAEASESAEVMAAAALKSTKDSAATRAAAECRKPTGLTVAREAIKLVASKGHLGWSSRGTLNVESCRMLAAAVREAEGGWTLAEEAEAHYPEADAYLKEMDPLVSIPVEEVDADVALGM